MALMLYVAVILLCVLAELLGLGNIDTLGWVLIIGLAVVGNALFITMFVTCANMRFADPSLTWLQIFYSGLWGALPLYALPQMRPILLMFYIPAFSFGMFRLSRKQYLALVAIVIGVYSAILLFHYSQAPATYNVKSEAFVFITFGIVLTWFSFFGGFISDLRKRLREQNAAVQKANQEIQLEIEERRQAQIEKDKLIVELRQALASVKTLSGLLPICASCKNIRDDKGYWNQLESYIANHSEAEFSHSICPACASKLYADVPGFRTTNNG